MSIFDKKLENGCVNVKEASKEAMENSSPSSNSEFQFRPKLQHQVEQMQHPADNWQHTQINSKTH